MKAANLVVDVVDDEPSVRTSLERLLRSASYRVETYASAADYLRKKKTGGTACLILDLNMPGLNGVELQEELSRRGVETSIIFITGHGDVRSSVRAMKNGAVDFLSKPYDQMELLNAVQAAVERSKRHDQKREEKDSIQNKVSSLTPREKEVLGWIISGMLNKQIAFKMGITEKTIKVHRAKVMEKMNVASVAELVRLTEKANLPPSAVAV
jgi:FixJ family two-component response regulator